MSVQSPENSLYYQPEFSELALGDDLDKPRPLGALEREHKLSLIRPGLVVAVLNAARFDGGVVLQWSVLRDDSETLSLEIAGKDETVKRLDVDLREVIVGRKNVEKLFRLQYYDNDDADTWYDVPPEELAVGLRAVFAAENMALDVDSRLADELKNVCENRMDELTDKAIQGQISFSTLEELIRGYRQLCPERPFYTVIASSFSDGVHDALLPREYFERLTKIYLEEQGYKQEIENLPPEVVSGARDEIKKFIVDWMWNFQDEDSSTSPSFVLYDSTESDS